MSSTSVTTVYEVSVRSPLVNTTVTFQDNKPGTQEMIQKTLSLNPPISNFATLENEFEIEEIKQSFSGTVLSISETDFTVRIQDTTNPNNSDEIIVLGREEIDLRDIDMLMPGAMLYWYIGYRYGIKCSKRRFSLIRFRCLPKWTNKEIEQAAVKTKEYVNFFKLN
jgi:hypothetical protein